MIVACLFSSFLLLRTRYVRYFMVFWCVFFMRVLMLEEEGNGNPEGVMENKVVEEIVLPLPISEDETQHDISNML